MRVATVDGLVTLYYDGSKELYNDELQRELRIAIGFNEALTMTLENWLRTRLFNQDTDIEALDLSDECKSYLRERLSWQQIIVVDGVTEVPRYTFNKCFNIKRVIFADTVIRIEHEAFFGCRNLVFIKWSLRLEYIGGFAFNKCNLSSVFIPPRCRQIGDYAFASNQNLAILNIFQDTELDNDVIRDTKLIQSCPNSISVNPWLKNINNDENFALHRVCSSFDPTLQMIVDTMKEKGGQKAFKVENGIGITPSKYLKENPYAHVKEKDIIEKYILQMMGENI